MPSKDLKFIQLNAFVPLGRVASTARRGRGWFDRVNKGDVVNLVVAETGDCFGRAVVVEKELVKLCDVLANADHNTAAFRPIYASSTPPDSKVVYELKMAYGDGLNKNEAFTILHLLPLNEPDEETPDEVEDDIEAKIERTQALCDACDVGFVMGAASVQVTETVGDISTTTRIDF